MSPQPLRLATLWTTIAARRLVKMLGPVPTQLRSSRRVPQRFILQEQHVMPMPTAHSVMEVLRRLAWPHMLMCALV